MKPVKVSVQTTSFITENLTPSEIREIVGTTLEFAAKQPEWRAGKYLRRSFTKNGQNYAIALDNRKEGYFAFLGLPQEVVQDI